MGCVICKINPPPLINKSLMLDKHSDNWLQYSGIGIQMAATVIICWWVGEKLESSIDFFNKPWGQLSGLFFGIFAGIYILVKQVK